MYKLLITTNRKSRFTDSIKFSTFFPNKCMYVCVSRPYKTTPNNILIWTSSCLPRRIHCTQLMCPFASDNAKMMIDRPISLDIVILRLKTKLVCRKSNREAHCDGLYFPTVQFAIDQAVTVIPTGLLRIDNDQCWWPQESTNTDIELYSEDESQSLLTGPSRNKKKVPKSAQDNSIQYTSLTLDTNNLGNVQLEAECIEMPRKQWQDA
ncbi:hypothetical protein JTE90_001092 [Oedothorax gibbosus]|uniref:Uncharacterized protein n=1 Tax=Oedothorax gibbosus TaxID=931172 RepID=A0AAV6UIN2_9ARAC|nr:hypothetical protein JTE90_001092 [Oedothorax gibbosus]